MWSPLQLKVDRGFHPKALLPASAPRTLRALLEGMQHDWDKILEGAPKSHVALVSLAVLYAATSMLDGDINLQALPRILSGRHCYLQVQDAACSTIATKKKKKKNTE